MKRAEATTKRARPSTRKRWRELFDIVNRDTGGHPGAKRTSGWTCSCYRVIGNAHKFLITLKLLSQVGR
jgi:hypothetical protein